MADLHFARYLATGQLPAVTELASLILSYRKQAPAFPIAASTKFKECTNYSHTMGRGLDECGATIFFDAAGGPGPVLSPEHSADSLSTLVFIQDSGKGKVSVSPSPKFGRLIDPAHGEFGGNQGLFGVAFQAKSEAPIAGNATCGTANTNREIGEVTEGGANFTSTLTCVTIDDVRFTPERVKAYALCHSHLYSSLAIECSVLIGESGDQGGAA